MINRYKRNLTAMRTRNFIINAAFACAIPATVSASASPGKEVVIDKELLSQLPVSEQERVLDLRARMEELIATDRKGLTADQRRELRAEWKSMKREMEDINSRSGGTVVYISTAGLIIIILLLIILL